MWIQKLSVYSTRLINLWNKVTLYDNVQNVEPNESAVIDIQYYHIVILLITCFFLWLLSKWLIQVSTKQ